jgi:hypothetical protein
MLPMTISLLKSGRDVEPLMTADVTALRTGVPPKSPDHQDVNTSHISIQTHREARRLTMSGDVWHCRHPPETSAGAAASSSKD